MQVGRAIGLGAFDFEGVEAVRVQIGTHGLDVERGDAAIAMQRMRSPRLRD